MNQRKARHWARRGAQHSGDSLAIAWLILLVVLALAIDYLRMKVFGLN